MNCFTIYDAPIIIRTDDDDASIASARQVQSNQFFGQRLRIQTYA